MLDLWDGLPVTVQDMLVALLLLAPAALIGLAVIRGFAPGPLIRAMIGRFFSANVLFVLLIAVSVGLGIGLIAQERGFRHGTAHAADKFDLVVTAPGSELTMMMAAVYLQPTDAPLLDGATYAELAGHENVALAAPLAFGDSYRGAPLVGTIADFARYLSSDRIEGRLWQTSSEAVIGAAVPLQIEDRFTPAHGMTGPHSEEEDEDHDIDLTVVGRLGVTGTPWDRAILVPIETIWEVHGLANGHALAAGDQIGPPFDSEFFPGTPAVIVRSEQLWANYALRSQFTRDKQTMAFFPGEVLARLYSVIGDVRQAMEILSLVSQILVAASVLLGLFILTNQLRRHMALLRALGAPGRFVFAVIWGYATSLLVIGAMLGLAVGAGAATALSEIVSRQTGIAISAPLGWAEIHLVAGFVSVSVFLALYPAYSVLRSPVATGLRS